MAPSQMPLRNRLLVRAAQRYWRISRGLTLGIRAVVIDPADRILLVRHGYLPGWHFPGGGVEWGEPAEVSLRRELVEETGIVVAPANAELVGLYANFDSFPGDHIALYVVREFSPGPVPPPSFEIREQRFFSRSDLPSEISAGTSRRLAELFSGAKVSAQW
jgi:ADP-ribose pyrophosphatase YjhB (NUDIX family)